jgi:hypothetical protein
VKIGAVLAMDSTKVGATGCQIFHNVMWKYQRANIGNGGGGGIQLVPLCGCEVLAIVGSLRPEHCKQTICKIAAKHAVPANTQSLKIVGGECKQRR